MFTRPLFPPDIIHPFFKSKPNLQQGSTRKKKTTAFLR